MIDTSQPVTPKGDPTRVGRVTSVGSNGLVVQWDDGGHDILGAGDLDQAVAPEGKSWPPNLERK